MPDLIARHRAAQLVSALTNPSLTALLGAMPARPGQAIAVEDVLAAARLDSRTGPQALAKALELGLIDTSEAGLVLNRSAVDQVAADLVADSPLVGLVAQHPTLASFVKFGRFVDWPSDPHRVDEAFVAIGELFSSGDDFDESDLGLVIAQWHDDPALVRRGLVDAGLLLRDEGSSRYRVP